MFDKAKYIITNIPQFELEDFMIYTCGILENKERGLIDDILNKLKFRCRYHKLSCQNSNDSTIKIYTTLAWLNYMSEKYDLGIKIKEGRGFDKDV